MRIQNPKYKIQNPKSRSAFTLTEVLVTIGIIVLLVSILIPVVGRVRRAAQNASAQAQINSIQGAIERYYQDHKAYPGPIPNASVGGSVSPNDDIQPPGGGTVMNADITMSENLVLALLGGLTIAPLPGSIPPYEVTYDVNAVGRGPMSMNLAQPKRYAPYLEAVNLSWTDGQGLDGVNTVNGIFADDASSESQRATGFDSAIPEFVDPYSNPLPILYYRANRGANGVASDALGKFGGAFPAQPPGGRAFYQYDAGQNAAYLLPDGQGNFIGVGKDISLGDYVNFTAVTPSTTKLPHGLRTLSETATATKGAATFQYPLDAAAYFRNPSVAPSTALLNTDGTARAKDSFILVSAGPDRVYGTFDDITSFGSVNP